MEQPFLQQDSAQDVSDFLLQHNNKLFSFVSELMVPPCKSKSKPSPTILFSFNKFCGRGGEKDALFNGSQWKALSLMYAAAWQA
eukprot:1157895-Pelagomonas_calceolata.AAC.1